MAFSSIRCPRCKSTNTILKGFRYNKLGPIQLFLCKSCGKKFSEKRAKMRELPENIAETYLFKALSLDAVLKIEKLGFSRTTLFRRIREQARGTPDWHDLLKAKKEQSNWGFVMGIDTTGLKIRGANYVYLHVADVTSADPLAYIVCRNKDVATIKPVLRRLKNLGYSPRTVVSDLAPELLNSVKAVFSNAIMQGCLFHLAMRLEEELPTKKSINKVGKEKVKLWRKVKGFINCAAISKNEDTRQQYLKKLRCLNLDEKSRSVVERFLINLKYYHTLDELKGCNTNILYNNVCESHIGLIKRLKRKMRGYKSIDSARDLIKLFWFLKRKNAVSFPKKEGVGSAYYVPLPAYSDYTNLAEFSKASGIPREVLNKTVQEMGRTIIGDYAFTKNQLKNMESSVSKMRKTSLDAIMHKIGLDQTTTTELLENLGFTILFKSFDPSNIIISFAGHE